MPKRLVIWAFMTGTGITMLLILRVPADGTVLLFALVEGVFTGGIFAMLPVIYADYYGRGSIGTIRGWTHPVVMVALAAGPLYGAVIFDALDSYTWMFVSFGAVLIGEGDLGQELGFPRQYDHPELLSAMAQVVDICKQHETIVGHPHATASNMQDLMDQAYEKQASP